ncbi:AraC family transcriptional regulator [Flavobacterium cutihirudinis]|uniref:AraC family transcriptional regulator n=1 Tax=Flavobacterium cutihirudinis TaxID=1265740 RepID=A0A3D9FQ98_9FLAO|nr:AraC family transcriptional regulator [Flavobacterium cutihirudinis]RED22649.1 AraC family transcriptional regulator [Flavobacterium cutihirudinis]
MKVFPFKIPKSGEEPLIYQEDIEVSFYDKLHQHEEIQISYIEKGEGAVFAGDTISQYHEGDILVIGSNLPHVFRSDVQENEISIMRTLFFTFNSFGKDFFELPTFRNIHPILESSKNGFVVRNAPKKMVKYFKKLKNADSYSRFILFLDIMKWLSTAESTPLSNYLYQKKITDNEGKKMQIVFDYVMTNYHQNITLEEIASIASMTKNAFCRYFKVRTNKSFFQFLIEVRIERAAKLLSSNGELSVLEIAESCGFNNISNFNRKFKELKQLSPLQYRKLNL